MKRRANIGDVVGRYIKLKRRGKNLVGLCPFHNEKTPSFNVHPDDGFYKCFGCGASGDAITFLRETENMSFMEAVQSLAEDAGMQMPSRDPKAAQREARRKSLSDVAEIAAKWFAAQLSGARAGAARGGFVGRARRGAAPWVDRVRGAGRRRAARLRAGRRRRRCPRCAPAARTRAAPGGARGARRRRR